MSILLYSTCTFHFGAVCLHRSKMHGNTSLQVAYCNMLNSFSPICWNCTDHLDTKRICSATRQFASAQVTLKVHINARYCGKLGDLSDLSGDFMAHRSRSQANGTSP
ncbi:TPA: hypothetical protein ACH3X3_011017 [Trebouxia sp. C0006]